MSIKGGALSGSNVDRQPSVTVGVAVRNTVTRHGLKELLRQLPSVVDVQELSPNILNLAGAREQLDLDIVIVAVCDVCDDAQLDATAACSTKLLLLVNGASENDIARSITMRCDGFLDSDRLTVAGIEQALTLLDKGEVPLPGNLTTTLLDRARRGDDAPRRTIPISLTPREIQVLSLLVDGLSNKQIARTLEISLHGAKRLVANVLAKLNCSNRTSAVSRALQENLIKPSGVNRSE